MQKSLSAYLDLVRYLAALVVFVGHASGRPWSGGLLWQAAAYLQTAVIVFFVLSGFVIAYVVETREQTASDYATSRLARLWSVALPALALTFAVDLAGLRIAPEIYVDKPWYHGDQLWLRYGASALFVHEVWDAGLVPGTNGPYWSIGYEAAYYLFFGLLVFVRNKAWAAMWVGAAMVAVGPTTVAMFPLWLLGVAAYRIAKRSSIHPALGWLLFVASIVLLAASPWFRQATLPYSIDGINRNAIVADYVDGIAFFFNIIAVSALANTVGLVLLPFRKAIAWLATGTFALYLFHRPLIQLYTYLGPDPADGWPRRILIFVGIPVTVAVLTPLTESFKRALKDRMTSLFHGRQAAPRTSHSP